MIRFYSQKITVVRIRKPDKNNLNEELQWLGSSLGLFNLRDKDKSCFRIFIELLKVAKSKRTITSDELAARTSLTRATVIHHIHRLIEAGIVVPEKNKYYLRVEKLLDLINEMERDVIQTCNDLREIADDIDRKMGL